MKHVITAAALAGAILCSPAAAETWHMPVAYPASNYHTQNTQRFAEAVKSVTDGQIEIVVHANGSLIRGNDIKRAVRTGQAPLGERLLSAHVNENDLYGVSELPFIAMTFEDAWKLYQASKPMITAELAKENLTLLYAVAWPPQGLFSRISVEQTEDLKGAKMRTSSPMMTQIIEKVGATATQMEAADLSQAYATGVVAAHLTSAASPWDSKLYEFAKFYYDFGGWVPLSYTFVNTNAWNKLNPETRAKVMGAAAMAERSGWAEAERLSRWYPEALASKGMTVKPPSQKLIGQFEKVGQEMLTAWLQKTGDAGRRVIDGYNGMKK